jgi:D-aminopeptidase
VITQHLVPEAQRATDTGPTVINQLFQAAIEATEEAILNSMFCAQTLAGRDGHVLYALPIEESLAILRQHGHCSS